MTEESSTSEEDEDENDALEDSPLEVVEAAETNEVQPPQIDLETTRDLMQKLIVIKNDYLDNLCRSELIT